MSDREGPRATASYSRNWLMLFATLMLTGVASFLLGLTVGPNAAAFLATVVLSVVAAVALFDGAWRLLGNQGVLGPGGGIDRFLALIQLILAVSFLISVIT